MENTILSLRQNRVVANWLLICCGLVFAMVVLGGVTRLTGSGLSMVEWRPVMGAVPPVSAEEWQEKFEIYQLTPEFQKVNSDFDLGDFKGIFWLEYLHRLLGRLIGLVFVLPLLYFAATGYIRMRDLPKYLFMLALGGGQAFIGKLMVASGQVDAPQVSHYRLTAHLSAAFLVYALMLWTALSLLFPAARGAIRHALYGRTVGVFALVCAMIVSGGFVAGLKAWKIYNTFPKMGDEWIPQGLTALSPLWRNAFDNMVTVQFNHRWLAVITFVTIVAYWFTARKTDLPKRARPAANALLHTVSLQVILGISALVLAVPVALGAAHQAVGLLLFTVMLYLVHTLRRVEVPAAAPGRN